MFQAYEFIHYCGEQTVMINKNSYSLYFDSSSLLFLRKFSHEVSPSLSSFKCCLTLGKTYNGTLEESDQPWEISE